MIFYECPGAVVSWDDAIKCVVLRFDGFIDGEDLRNAALSVLKLLKRHGARKVLTDSREMKALTQEDQRWIDVEWQGKARGVGLAYDAVVLPKSAVAKMSVAAVLKKMPGTIEFAHFSSPEQAKEWLRSK